MPAASTVGPLPVSLLYVAPLLNKVPGTRRPGLQHLCHCGAPWLATSSRWLSATAPRPASRSAAAPGQQHLPDGSSLQRPRPAAPPRRPGQPAAQPQRPASNIFPMALRCSALGQQLRHGALASNKPHLAEKNTPVWLAIWRIWAGFANSQLRRAAFRSTY